MIMKVAGFANVEKIGSEILLQGRWDLAGLSEIAKRIRDFSLEGVTRVDAQRIESMDTAGAWLIHKTFGAIEIFGLKPEHASLVELVGRSVRMESRPSKTWLERLGKSTWIALNQSAGMLSFIGETAYALMHSLSDPGRIRWKPIWHNLQHAGFDALPIAGLLSFLMGIVIAYQGAEQLARYGANIFVVNLVGLSMLRELGPLLTAIIIAGRSGSAFTAQIGTMRVTEEIDAMKTIGISPMDQLVLPKIIALLIALPLLSVYADIMGVLGGMIMASFNLGVGYTDFIDRFGSSIRLSAFLVGIGKAPVFAVIIGVVGCFQGFQVSGGADSVGRQTTKSVVQSIFLVIVADAIFSVIFSLVNL
ncbi:MAG TPA: ABC transporter permease [Burkholderiales bacterium]|nr:ABC transporter permease [Burkholderiales bacterium]